MAHNRRYNANNAMNVSNNERYDPEATQALRALIGHSFPNGLNAIKMEIRRGADPHVLLEPLPPFLPPPDYNGVWLDVIQPSPFEILASTGEADFLQELFAMGLEPTRDMLIRAIKSKKNTLKTIDAILGENPDMINMRGNDGFDKDTTPLIAAIKKDVSPEIIEHLFKRGADPNLQASDGRTPLMYATKLRKSVVEMLLRHGADPQLVNKQGRRAFNHAKTKVMKNLLTVKGGRRKTRRSKHKKQKRGKTSKRR